MLELCSGKVRQHISQHKLHIKVKHWWREVVLNVHSVLWSLTWIFCHFMSSGHSGLLHEVSLHLPSNTYQIVPSHHVLLHNNQSPCISRNLRLSFWKWEAARSKTANIFSYRSSGSVLIWRHCRVFSVRTTSGFFLFGFDSFLPSIHHRPEGRARRVAVAGLSR